MIWIILGALYILIVLISGMARAYYLDAVFERDDVRYRSTYTQFTRQRKWDDQDAGLTIFGAIFWPLVLIGYPLFLLGKILAKALQNSIRYLVNEKVNPRDNA